VKLAVYDVSGKEVAVIVNEIKKAGTYTAEFDGSGLPSGIYFCRMQAGNFTEVRKLMLVK
jgi:hypothetical protein